MFIRAACADPCADVRPADDDGCAVTPRFEPVAAKPILPLTGADTPGTQVGGDALCCAAKAIRPSTAA